MTLQTICVLITCIIAVGGILIYVGKSIHTLSQIDANQTVLFDKAEKNATDIARIDKELVQVKTRQEDCEKCP